MVFEKMLKWDKDAPTGNIFLSKKDDGHTPSSYYSPTTEMALKELMEKCQKSSKKKGSERKKGEE